MLVANGHGLTAVKIPNIKAVIAVPPLFLLLSISGGAVHFIDYSQNVVGSDHL